MKDISKSTSQNASTIPSDDLQRRLTHARPNEDQNCVTSVWRETPTRCY
jgi:hypothetical protein